MTNRRKTVRPGQVYRDLARDMTERDRRLQVLEIGDDGRAACLVVHDHGGTEGRRTKIKASALASAQYELLPGMDEDLATEPLYTALAAVHGPSASLDDYARAGLAGPARGGPERAVSAGPADPGVREEGGYPVADPGTGEIRVLSRKCDTCVLNPAATAVPLAPGRRKAFIEEARAHEDGSVICHSTLPPAAPPGTLAAMCRGFVDAYGLPAAAVEAIAHHGAHTREVDPPEKSSRPPAGDTTGAPPVTEET
ncbi:DUF6354 family protein [Streptomyces roseolus]|uniref:DUF6354 family protein n=1 Tax=Streptomyces roseolus TaxID=67358 RepID=UPI0037BB2BBD